MQCDASKLATSVQEQYTTCSTYCTVDGSRSTIICTYVKPARASARVIVIPSTQKTMDDRKAIDRGNNGVKNIS